MSQAITPAVNTATNTWHGTGIVYKNFGLATQRELGATRGDIKFGVDREFKHVDYNGQYGPTKGNKYIVQEVSSVEFDLIELGWQNFEDCYSGCVITDEGTYHKVTGDLAVAAGDYHDNIVWAGVRDDGKYALLYVNNALGDGKIEFAIKDKETIANNVKFTGHYDKSDPTTPPWEIRMED